MFQTTNNKGPPCSGVFWELTASTIQIASLFALFMTPFSTNSIKSHTSFLFFECSSLMTVLSIAITWIKSCPYFSSALCLWQFRAMTQMGFHLALDPCLFHPSNQGSQSLFALYSWLVIHISNGESDSWSCVPDSCPLIVQ